MSRADIRKSLEIALKTAMDTAQVRVSWENDPFDPDGLDPFTNAKTVRYVRFTFHPVNANPMTIGPGPRVQDEGFIKCDTFVRAGQMPDLPDDVDDLVRQAFPLGSVFTRGESQVQITRSVTAQAVEFEGWFYVPRSIYWTRWGDFDG